jgi:hypothetical protein
MKAIASLLTIALGGAAIGCASAPAAPFDTLKTSNVLAFRLQNFEPPPPVAAAPSATPQAPMIPGIPPEITQWAQQALPGLQQFLPPGLIPGAGAAAAAPPPPAPEAPRFPMAAPNFRILNQTQVLDPAVKEELGKLLGDPDNFQADHGNCMYAEMGLSFSGAASPQPNDLLISFSCNQIDSRTFAWPHPNHGLKPDTVKKLETLVQKIWPMG